jgi:hypothetical protein
MIFFVYPKPGLYIPVIKKKKKKKSLEDRITESRSLEIFFLRRRGREGGPFGGLEMPRGK